MSQSNGVFTILNHVISTAVCAYVFCPRVSRPAGFRAERLPLRAQFGPVFGLATADLSGDGRSEILLGGNLFEVRPQQGPYDALRGTVLRFDAERDQLLAYPADATGFDVFGQLRQLRVVCTSDGSLRVIAARYDDEVLIFGFE